MIKREQRLLAGSAERSNFTESKVNLIKNHVKIKTVSHCPWLRSFRLAWGLRGKISARRLLFLHQLQRYLLRHLLTHFLAVNPTLQIYHL